MVRSAVVDVDSAVEILASLSEVEWRILGTLNDCSVTMLSDPGVLGRSARARKEFIEAGFAEDGDVHSVCERLRQRLPFDATGPRFFYAWAFTRILFQVLLEDDTSQEMRKDTLGLVTVVKSVPEAWKEEFSTLTASVGGPNEAFELIGLVDR